MNEGSMRIGKIEIRAPLIAISHASWQRAVPLVAAAVAATIGH